jgi:hypothetical protein
MLQRALMLFVAAAALSSGACSDQRDWEHGSVQAVGTQSSSSQKTPRPTAQSVRRPAAPDRYKGPLPTVPRSPYAAAPPDVIDVVYEFAARRPDVLRHVPCFCGCERNGHKDNEDCFVANRAANGRPEWDEHGLT